MYILDNHFRTHLLKILRNDPKLLENYAQSNHQALQYGECLCSQEVTGHLFWGNLIWNKAYIGILQLK